LLHTYDFCSSSGTLGLKRKRVILQIPEGVYSINHFNPLSNFYLSLGINYPNESDKILSDKKHPGGAIYIHGGLCNHWLYSDYDESIKELYILAVEAKNGGQDKIPVHIFPKLDVNGIDFLRKETADIETIRFWENLQLIYQDFESSKKLKSVKVDKSGRYSLQ
jgi:murein L,D-transpeptidase YafK